MQPIIDPFEALAKAYAPFQRSPYYEATAETGRALATCLDALKPRARGVVEARYGIRTGEPQTIRQLASVMQVSTSRVRAIHNNAFYDLREPWRRRHKLLRTLRQSPGDPNIAIEAVFPDWNQFYSLVTRPPLVDVFWEMGVLSLRDVTRYQSTSFHATFRTALGVPQDPRSRPHWLFDEESRIDRSIRSRGLAWNMDDQAWQIAILRAERLGCHTPIEEQDLRPSS